MHENVSTRHSGLFLSSGSLTAMYVVGLMMMTMIFTAAREQEPASDAAGYSRPIRATGDATRDVAMKVALANALSDEGKGSEALTLYKESIEEAEKASEEVKDAAREMAAEKDWSVTELLRRPLSPSENKKAIRQLLMWGDTWLAEGDYDRAVEAYEKVFILDPLNAKASGGIDKARRALIKERKHEQKNIAASLGEEDSELIQTELNRALHMIQSGNTGLAKIHLERVLFIDPEHEEARRLLRQMQSENA